MPELKKRAANSWSAVQDTYYSTKVCFAFIILISPNLSVLMELYDGCNPQLGICYSLVGVSTSLFSCLNLGNWDFCSGLDSFAVLLGCVFPDQDTFERDRVVFTIGTSIASVATALIG